MIEAVMSLYRAPGFIVKDSGLKSDCPLSLYLFFLCTDPPVSRGAVVMAKKLRFRAPACLRESFDSNATQQKLYLYHDFEMLGAVQWAPSKPGLF